MICSSTERAVETGVAKLQQEPGPEWLLARQAEGMITDALAGATPYQRLFGLVLTGCYLAKGGLSGVSENNGEGRIALCRFAAENLLAEAAAMKDRVVNGAASLAAARSALA